MKRSCWVVIGSALLAVTTVARADEPVVAPQLLEQAPLQVPAGERREGRVVLEVLVGEDGQVREAVIVESAGEPFDSLALEAARHTRWAPAQRGAEVLAARVRFALPFAPPAPVQPPRPAPAPAAAPEPSTSADGPEFAATGRVSQPVPVGVRALSREEVASVAGTNGDSLRALEVLPSVGRPNLGSGALLVRGTAPEDTEVFLDGTPVLFLYHMGGIESFMASALIDRVELHPSNFSVRFGRRIGGVVDVRVRDPEPDGFHGALELDVIDGSIVAEAPIGRIGGVALAARRSWIDLVFDGLVPDGAFDVVAAPVFWDYQLVAALRPSPRDHLRGLVYGSHDSMELVFADPSDADPTFQGTMGAKIGFDHAQLEWEHRFSETLEQSSSLTFAEMGYAMNVADTVRLRIGGPGLYGRSEWRLSALPGLQLTGGLDLSLVFARASYEGPPGSLYGDPRTDPSLLERVQLDPQVFTTFRPAAYLEAELRPLDPLRIVAGVRADYFGDVDAWSVDPRLRATLALGPDTTLTAAAGLFSQPPWWGEAMPELGNPSLEPERAVHGSVGVTRRLGDQVEVELEGYGRWLFDRIVPGSPEAGVPLVNDGVGRVYGVEASARLAPGDGPLFGMLSYGLSRSERRDGDEPWRLFEFDQTHSLSIALGARLPGHWELSGTFRYVSGNPTTPIVQGVYDADRDLYGPVYGDVNSVRNPPFHRLDLRVQKTFLLGPARIAVFLDVQNVYNRPNREGVAYAYDFRSHSGVSGLPILPNLGLRGEL